MIYGHTNLSPRATGGRRRRLSYGPQLAGAARRVFLQPRDRLGRQGLRHRPHDRRQAVSDDQPDRGQDSHSQHAVRGDRRSGNQRRQHRRRGPGRRHPHALHDRAEAAAGFRLQQRRRHPRFGELQRDDGGRRAGDYPAARWNGTASGRATRRTSPCRTWPRSPIGWR